MTKSSSNDDARINSLIAGKYRIERRLARGGMGVVYLARHELMDRPVALKVLHDSLHQHEQAEVFFKRFLREARAASQLSHPNAVTIYDFGLENEVPYLAMQYIAGRNLSTVLSAEERLSLERALPLFEQMCSAIDAAHKLSIAHRDIKPENILVSTQADGRETAHVLDFGIAKATQGSSTMVGAMTAVGKTVGTPRYMSPEQALGQEVDLRTDVYSLGVVFYEMLVGDIPFSAKTPVELMYEHLNSEPKPFPSELAFPRSLQDAVFKALEKQPDRRYATPLDFVAAVKESLRGTAVDTQMRKAARRSTLPVIGVAVGISIAIAMLMVLIWPSPDPVVEQTAELEQPSLEVLSAVPNEAAVSTDEAESKAPTDEELVGQAIPTQADISSPESVQSAATPTQESVVETTARVEPSLETAQDPIEQRTQEVAALEASPDQPRVAEAPNNAKEEQRDLEEQVSVDQMARKRVSALIALLGAEDRSIRIEAALELQNRGQEAVPPLIEALDAHPSPRVRYLSAFILGKMKAEAARPALERAREDSAGLVSETARRALLSMDR